MAYLFCVRRPKGARITKDELCRVAALDRDLERTSKAALTLHGEAVHLSWIPAPPGPPDVISPQNGVLVCFQPSRDTVEKLHRIARQLRAEVYDPSGRRIRLRGKVFNVLAMLGGKLQRHTQRATLRAS